jgi:DNA repair protein SbcC/Rad50
MATTPLARPPSFDAFLWLLFGKDSSDRTDFEIKHISQNGTGVTKETEVEGSLAVNGQEIILKRIYREKWMRKRGAAEVEFTGHETIYHYNDVPITQKEYNARIADICPEHLFRLITNPLYFTSLKWQMQRELLFNMVSGDGSDSELAEGNPAFESLLNELSGKTLDDFKKQLANAKRRVKDELDLIPARIDEVNRSLPAQENWDELTIQLTSNMQLLSQIEASIEDQSQAYQEVYAHRSKLQVKLHQSRSALQQIMMNAEDALNIRKVRHNQQLAHTTDTLKSLQLQIHRIQEEKARQITNRDAISLEMEHLRSKWHTENSKELVFDEQKFICPTCKRNVRCG